MTARESQDCRVAAEWIVSGGAQAPPAAVARHLAECPHCAELARLPILATGALAADEMSRIKASLLDGGLRAVTPLPSNGFLAASLLVILSAVLALGSWILGTGGWSARTTAARAGIFLPLLGATCLLVFAAARQMIPGSGSIDRWWKAASGVFVIAAPAAMIVFGPEAEPHFLHTGLYCLSLSMASAAVGFTALWLLLLHRGALLSPAESGWMTGGLTGIAMVAMAEIRCPNLNLHHILLWHLPVAFVTALCGGAAIGFLWTQISPRRN